MWPRSEPVAKEASGPVQANENQRAPPRRATTNSQTGRRPHFPHCIGMGKAVFTVWAGRLRIRGGLTPPGQRIVLGLIATLHAVLERLRELAYVELSFRVGEARAARPQSLASLPCLDLKSYRSLIRDVEGGAARVFQLDDQLDPVYGPADAGFRSILWNSTNALARTLRKESFGLATVGAPAEAAAFAQR